MKTVLVTGFEPFGGEAVNPSYAVARALPGQIGEARVAALELPVSFAGSGPALTAALEEHRPDVALCLGQAGGYAALALERVAVNLRDAATPDNLGAQPSEEPVVPGGPAAYFAALPVKALAAAMGEAGCPAFVSNSAGTYVCNNVMYTLLDWIARRAPATRGGFIHVPYLPAQAARKGASTPSMELERMTAALELVIRSLI